jgi:hypothetical protein
MVEDYAPKILDSFLLSSYKSILLNQDFNEGTDYRALLNVRKQRRMMEQLRQSNTKNINTWY